jgi:hypothetical protein
MWISKKETMKFFSWHLILTILCKNIEDMNINDMLISNPKQSKRVAKISKIFRDKCLLNA